MIDTPTAVIIGAVLATVGWLYIARRHRTLARKQNSLNTLLTASLDKEIRENLKILSPYLLKKEELILNNDTDKNLRYSLQILLNHYEFVAVGIRNGDLDEVLIRDSEHGTILCLFACSTKYIDTLRNTRPRRSIYENLEWLCKRWGQKPPGLWQRAFECIRGRPIKGSLEKVLG